MKYFLNVYSSAQQPPITTLRNASGKVLATLLDNADLKKKADSTLGQKEFFTFTTSEGVTLNGWMIKPRDFDPAKKYPVIMYQYSGPGSQEVKDSWNMGFFSGGAFESYMAEQGYVYVCVDGRGTGGRGAEFEKCTYLNLGVKEARDQVETALYLGTLPYVDKNNIGIWGWSFGGYCTLMAMSEGTPVFKAGVAVAAPSDWRFYDTVYTERFMRTPKENMEGYEASSAMNRVDKLHGELLLMHGTADDNVHLRNASEYSEALVQADKQFDMHIYTNRNHGIRGGNTTKHLLTRVTNHFIEHLK
jgi:dipeptidyl-peptidase-4